MIVRCPACSRRYTVDDKAMLPHGRNVRCVACSYVWYQDPEIVHEAQENPVLRNFRDVEVSPRLHKGRWPAWVGGILFIGTITALLVTIVFSRNAIVSLWPKAEVLYSMVGVPVASPGMGLTLTNTSTQEEHEGGRDVYRVQGDITNVSDRVKELPMIRISLVGAPARGKCIQMVGQGQCLLDKWEHKLAKDSLLPGEQIHFETSSRPRIQSASSVIVEF